MCHFHFHWSSECFNLVFCSISDSFRGVHCMLDYIGIRRVEWWGLKHKIYSDLSEQKNNAKVELEGVAPVSGKLHALEPGKFLLKRKLHFKAYVQVFRCDEQIVTISTLSQRTLWGWHNFQHQGLQIMEKTKKWGDAETKDKKTFLFFTLLLFLITLFLSLRWQDKGRKARRRGSKLAKNAVTDIVPMVKK